MRPRVSHPSYGLARWARWPAQVAPSMSLTTTTPLAKNG